MGKARDKKNVPWLYFEWGAKGRQWTTGVRQTQGANLEPASRSWHVPPSRAKGLGRVLFFYLRLDSSACFLDYAVLEVIDAIATTGIYVPSSDETQNQRTESCEGEMKTHPGLMVGHFSWKYHR